VRDRLEVFGRDSADELAMAERGLDARLGDLASGLAEGELNELTSCLSLCQSRRARNIAQARSKRN